MTLACIAIFNQIQVVLACIAIFYQIQVVPAYVAIFLCMTQEHPILPRQRFVGTSNVPHWTAWCVRTCDCVLVAADPFSPQPVLRGHEQKHSPGQLDTSEYVGRDREGSSFEETIIVNHDYAFTAREYTFCLSPLSCVELCEPDRDREGSNAEVIISDCVDLTANFHRTKVHVVLLIIRLCQGDGAQRAGPGHRRSVFQETVLINRFKLADTVRSMLTNRALQSGFQQN